MTTLRSELSGEQDSPAAVENISCNDEDRSGKRNMQGALVVHQVSGKLDPAKSAKQATPDELGGHPPIDQTRRRIVKRCCQCERSDSEKRGGDRIEYRHAGRKNETGDDQKSTANAEEPGGKTHQ